MINKILALSILILFSLSMASAWPGSKNVGKNYKKHTLIHKNNKMEALGLSKGYSLGRNLVGDREPMIPANGNRDCDGLGQEDCEWLDFCLWTEDGCIRIDEDSENGDECYQFEYEDECLAFGCSWDDDEGCYRFDGDWDDTCYQIWNEDECVDMMGCDWDNEEGCYNSEHTDDYDADEWEDECRFIDSAEECLDLGCQWDEEGCFSPDDENEEEVDSQCYYFDNIEECLVSGCEWNQEEGCFDPDDFEEDNWGNDCEELSQDECIVVDGCIWSYDEGYCSLMDEDDTAGCQDGYLFDCSGDGDCCPESWIGDGFTDCEDQAYGCDLTCYDNDGADCESNSDGGGEYECSDLGYEDCEFVDDCYWIESNEPTSEGVCLDSDSNDDGGDDGGEYSCSDLGYEDCIYVDDCEWISGWDDGAGGFCVEAGWSDEGCSDGYIEDCSGDGDCCPESWVGDGFTDCEDQAWGCDLSCYDNDGEDCSDGWEDDGGDDGGEYECSDLGYEDCMFFDFCEWISNSDNPAAGGFCVEVNWEDDGGDDGENEDCGDGYVDDCSGDGDCCPEGWIGDGFSDCEDQSYGCDLTCYDNDGSDCDENTDGGGWYPEAALIIGETSSVPGGEAIVDLRLESSVPVSGIQFTLNPEPFYWASLVDVNVMNLTGDCFEANFNNTDSGTVVLIYSLSGCQFNPSEESMQIGSLVFEVSDSAEFGEYIELYFSELIVATSGGESVDAEGYGGLINIGITGDLNQDGEVNVVDAVLIVQFILMFEYPSESQFWSGDLNQDGTLDILDVVLLVEAILG